MKKAKQLSNTHTHTHTHTDNSVVTTRGGGGGRHYRGINGDGKRLDMGWSTHDTIYRS